MDTYHGHQCIPGQVDVKYYRVIFTGRYSQPVNSMSVPSLFRGCSLEFNTDAAGQTIIYFTCYSAKVLNFARYLVEMCSSSACRFRCRRHHKYDVPAHSPAGFSITWCTSNRQQCLPCRVLLFTRSARVHARPCAGPHSKYCRSLGQGFPFVASHVVVSAIKPSHLSSFRVTGSAKLEHSLSLKKFSVNSKGRGC